MTKLIFPPVYYFEIHYILTKEKEEKFRLSNFVARNRKLIIYSFLARRGVSRARTVKSRRVAPGRRRHYCSRRYTEEKTIENAFCNAYNLEHENVIENFPQKRICNLTKAQQRQLSAVFVAYAF